MKVLILTNCGSGLFHFRKELLKALSTQHEVHIAFPKDEYVDKLVKVGCVYHRFEFFRHGTNPFKEFQLILRYKKLIKKIQPDIVLTYTIKPNVYGGLACQLLKVPYITNVTGLGIAILNGGLMSKITLFLYKIGLNKATTVFFQNEENKNFFIKKHIVKQNYRLLPGSGVNLNEFSFCDYPDENEPLKFLFIGRIMKDKGIEEFLQCAKHIKAFNPNIQFDIIGGFDEDKYKPIITEYENAKIINYFGVQSDVKPFIKSHHAIILPSYHEGTSNVLLESAACGRPVIATDVAGCRETYDDEISGIGCKAKSCESLITAVEKFLNFSYSQKAEMGIAARKKIESQFDRKIVIDAYINEINKLL